MTGMKCALVSALLSALFISGSACTVSEADAPKPTLKAAAQLRAMLESARHQLLQYEVELGRTEKEIKAGQDSFNPTATSRLLTKREQLKEKVLQSKVEVRELEILLDEEQQTGF